MKPKPLPKNGKNAIFPTTPTGTELASYDQKLNFILHTSAQVFAEKGYDRASLRDISRATGFSLAGLYYYFRSKEELLFLISDITFATIWKRLEQALTPQDSEALPAIEQLNRLIFNHLDFYVAHMPEMKVLSVEADALGGEWQKQVNDRKRRYTERCVKILTDLQAQVGHEPNPTECRLSALALFGMMNWLYQWYDPKRDGSATELSAKMSAIFLHGFLPRETRAEEGGLKTRKLGAEDFGLGAEDSQARG